MNRWNKIYDAQKERRDISLSVRGTTEHSSALVMKRGLSDESIYAFLLSYPSEAA